MTKASMELQNCAGGFTGKRSLTKSIVFGGSSCNVAKMEVLAEAYRQAKKNGGAPGIDGQTFEDVEASGAEAF